MCCGHQARLAPLAAWPVLAQSAVADPARPAHLVPGAAAAVRRVLPPLPKGELAQAIGFVEQHPTAGTRCACSCSLRARSARAAPHRGTSQSSRAQQQIACSLWRWGSAGLWSDPPSNSALDEHLAVAIVYTAMLRSAPQCVPRHRPVLPGTLVAPKALMLSSKRESRTIGPVQ